MYFIFFDVYIVKRRDRILVNVYKNIIQGNKMNNRYEV